MIRYTTNNITVHTTPINGSCILNPHFPYTSITHLEALNISILFLEYKRPSSKLLSITNYTEWQKKNEKRDHTPSVNAVRFLISHLHDLNDFIDNQGFYLVLITNCNESIQNINNLKLKILFLNISLSFLTSQT